MQFNKNTPKKLDEEARQKIDQEQQAVVAGDAKKLSKNRGRPKRFELGSKVTVKIQPQSKTELELLAKKLKTLITGEDGSKLKPFIGFNKLVESSIPHQPLVASDVMVFLIDVWQCYPPHELLILSENAEGEKQDFSFYIEKNEGGKYMDNQIAHFLNVKIWEAQAKTQKISRGLIVEHLLANYQRVNPLGD